MLFPIIAYAVVAAGANEPDSDEAKEAKAYFQTAVTEAFANNDKSKNRKLASRALRVSEKVIAPFNKGTEGRVDKVGLVLYHMLRWVTDADYLVIPDETPMRKGLDMLLPGLEHAASEERLNRSALKAAKKMMSALQEEGYFEGVTVQ